MVGGPCPMPLGLRVMVMFIPMPTRSKKWERLESRTGSSRAVPLDVDVAVVVKFMYID